MNDSLRKVLAVVLLVVAGGAGYEAYQQYKSTDCKGPNCPLKPSPAPLPPNPPLVPPKPKPSPWGPRSSPSVEGLRSFRGGKGNQVLGGPVGPEGQEVMCDLPVDLRLKNIGGVDGSGLCVFTSINHSARYQNVRDLWDFQKQMSHEPGGGWPEKVDRMLAKYAPKVHYLQAETLDPSVLELALKTGRMPSLTYDGRDLFYGSGTRVAHMVNCVYLDDKRMAFLDNNNIQPDDKSIMWMSRAEGLDRWKGRDKLAWAVVLLAPGAPPVPVNPK